MNSSSMCYEVLSCSFFDQKLGIFGSINDCVRCSSGYIAPGDHTLLNIEREMISKETVILNFKFGEIFIHLSEGTKKTREKL